MQLTLWWNFVKSQLKRMILINHLAHPVCVRSIRSDRFPGRPDLKWFIFRAICPGVCECRTAVSFVLSLRCISAARVPSAREALGKIETFSELPRNARTCPAQRVLPWYTRPGEHITVFCSTASNHHASSRQLTFGEMLRWFTIANIAIWFAPHPRCPPVRQFVSGWERVCLTY